MSVDEEGLALFLGPHALQLLDARIEAKVQEILASRERGRWLTVKAAAEYLGLSEKSIRRRIERGEIAVTRQGRRVLVDGLALDRELRGAAHD